MHEHCLLLFRPSRYGVLDLGAVEAFLVFLELYLLFQNAPEEPQLLVASSLLEGAPWEWLLYQSNGSPILESTRVMKVLQYALRCGLFLTSARERSLAGLRNRKQRKPIGRMLQRQVSPPCE